MKKTFTLTHAHTLKTLTQRKSKQSNFNNYREKRETIYTRTIRKERQIAVVSLMGCIVRILKEGPPPHACSFFPPFLNVLLVFYCFSFLFCYSYVSPCGRSKPFTSSCVSNWALGVRQYISLINSYFSLAICIHCTPLFSYIIPSGTYVEEASHEIPCIPPS